MFLDKPQSTKIDKPKTISQEEGEKVKLSRLDPVLPDGKAQNWGLRANLTSPFSSSLTDSTRTQSDRKHIANSEFKKA
jgi:hypothetical protein